MIDRNRLSRITSLKKGETFENDDVNLCVMEAVAWVSHEPWSAYPKCSCPVLSAVFQTWNDYLSDSERHILIPFIPRLVGTKSTKEIEYRRGMMAVDWLIRVYTPTWFRVGGLISQAEKLEGSPEIKDKVPSLHRFLFSITEDVPYKREGSREDAGLREILNAISGSELSVIFNTELCKSVFGVELTKACNSLLRGAWNSVWSELLSDPSSISLDTIKSTRLKLQKSTLDLGDRMILAEMIV